MQGYLVRPRSVDRVYIAGSDASIVKTPSQFLLDMNLQSVSGQLNKVGIETDWHDLGEIYNYNLKALLESDLCIAVLKSSLTDIADICVEIGLAYANSIPILAFCTSPELRASPMVIGMCGGDEQIAYSIEELRESVEEHIDLVDAALQASN